jgi:hypothetical protein
MVSLKGVAVALLSAVSTVQGHYVYSILTVDGQRTNDWQYSKSQAFLEFQLHTSISLIDLRNSSPKQ